MDGDDVARTGDWGWRLGAAVPSEQVVGRGDVGAVPEFEVVVGAVGVALDGQGGKVELNPLPKFRVDRPGTVPVGRILSRVPGTLYRSMG